MHEIDSLNILHATMLAMTRAVQGLHIKPEWALIDGNRVPKDIGVEASAVVKGDALVPENQCCFYFWPKWRGMKKCSSWMPLIRTMVLLDHKGYPTAQHLAAIKTHGVIAEHRRSFKPVRDVLEQING